MGARERLATVARAMRGDPQSRYIVAERIAATIHPDAVLGEEGKLWVGDADFRAIYERFQGRDLRRMERAYLLDQLAQLAVSVEGDTAECGVYTGLTSYLICRRVEGSGKLHHAFDSWEGLSTPGGDEEGHWVAGELSVPETSARANLERFDFVRYHRGWIPDRFPEVADRRFSFVHLDVDLRDPTRDSLEFFYPRMSSGAVLLCDDYGLRKCPGVREAMIDYFANKPEAIVELPTSQAFVVRSAD